MNAELLIDARAQLGEGALWDQRTHTLLWADITGGIVHRFNPASGASQHWEVGPYVGTIVLRASGGAVLATQNGFVALDFDTGTLTSLNDPESDVPGNRFNDGKCDPAGRLWAGTMSLHDEEHTGTLWRLNADLSCTAMIADVSISNGLTWSSDQRTFYYIDTPTFQVVAYDYDIDSGDIYNRRIAIEVDRQEGGPDGMCIDAEDKLWIAHWGGGRVVRWDPHTGELMTRIHVPAAHTSSCAFGGPGLETLYITTAREGMSEDALAQQPHSGGLFVAHPKVSGQHSSEFAG